MSSCTLDYLRVGMASPVSVLDDESAIALGRLWRARECEGRWIIERAVGKSDNGIIDFEFFADGGSEANARLIASAPSMLAMLERLRGMLGRREFGGNHGVIEEIEGIISDAGGVFIRRLSEGGAA